MRENLKEPAVLLARDSVNNVVPAYAPAVDVVSQRGEGMIRDREALEKEATSPIGIPQRYLDVHAFFFGPPLDGESWKILHRYRPDYLMVRRDEPLAARLEKLPAFTPIPTPSDEHALYKVDLERLTRHQPANPESGPQEKGVPPASSPSGGPADG
jgi:hypothetical protein